MNYMPEIAKLLGVEIDEEFKIEGHLGHNVYKLTEESMEFLSCG